MSTKVGERVGAVLSAKDGVVHFFGWGTYVGDRVPEEAIGFLAEGAREIGLENPCIELESGGVVYGCECWWGVESGVRKRFEGFTFVDVDVNKWRSENKDE